ncbi:MAG: hypothetical protein JWQ58_1716 [Reyranella sp.]|nr:hypothetical protein [Reyranella sp.]
MFLRFFAPAAVLALSTAIAQAQSPTLSFDSAAYVTCREAQAMTPEARRAVAAFLVERTARRHGVVIPEDERGAQLGHLVRGGCTLAPDAYLYAAIDRAVISEVARLPKR